MPGNGPRFVPCFMCPRPFQCVSYNSKKVPSGYRFVRYAKDNTSFACSIRLLDFRVLKKIIWLQ